MSRQSHREQLLLQLAETVDPAEIELIGTLLISTIDPSFTVRLVNVPDDGSTVKWYEPIPDGVGRMINVIPTKPKPVIQFSLRAGTYTRIVNVASRCNDRLRCAGMPVTTARRSLAGFDTARGAAS